MSALVTDQVIAQAYSRETYLRALGVEIARDGWFHMLVLAYALTAAGLALWLGTTEKLVYLQSAPILCQGVGLVALVYFTIVEVPASIRADTSRPLARVIARAPDMANPRAVAAIAMVASIIIFFGTFTSMKNMLPDLTDFRWDATFADIDRALHGGQDPWLWLQPVMGHHFVTRTVQIFYTGVWMIALCAVPMMIAASRRMAHLRLRFFLTYAFCWIVIGNILAGVFMSAGPVYFGEVTGDFARFGAQMRYLSFSDGMIHSSYELQNTLWALHKSNTVELGTGIAAFPSVHVAMATLFALTGWSVNRVAGLLGTTLLVVILAGSVHLAWHYAIDGYASLLLILTVWFSIGAIQRWRAAKV